MVLRIQAAEHDICTSTGVHSSICTSLSNSDNINQAVAMVMVTIDKSADPTGLDSRLHTYNNITAAAAASMNMMGVGVTACTGTSRPMKVRRDPLEVRQKTKSKKAKLWRSLNAALLPLPMPSTTNPTPCAAATTTSVTTATMEASGYSSAGTASKRMRAVSRKDAAVKAVLVVEPLSQEEKQRRAEEKQRRMEEKKRACENAIREKAFAAVRAAEHMLLPTCSI